MGCYDGDDARDHHEIPVADVQHAERRMGSLLLFGKATRELGFGQFGLAPLPGAAPHPFGSYDFNRSRHARGLSLNVLHLFAHSLKLGFELNHEMGHWCVAPFRADGVRLPPELLEQEVEAPSRRLADAT